MRAVRNEEDRETLIFGLVAEREREEKAPSKVRNNKISFLSFVMFFFLFSKLEIQNRINIFNLKTWIKSRRCQ